MITFTKVRLPYGWLSNMSPHSVTTLESRGNWTWRTAEALFQASRFRADHPVRELIREATSPMGAKMLAKGLVQEMIIQPRSPEDLDLMRQVVGLKLEQHQFLQQELLATGDEELVEDVTARQSASGLFWGKGRALYQPTSQQWFGDNWLGKIWMEHRARLRDGHSMLSTSGPRQELPGDPEVLGLEREIDRMLDRTVGRPDLPPVPPGKNSCGSSFCSGHCGECHHKS